MNSNPSTFSLALRMFMVYALFHLALVSCTPITPPPPQNDGPAFVINSPSEGAAVSGATFFSVQPFDTSEVQSVSFTANGTELAVDTSGEDTFKVFLIPRDFPDGELTLSAVVTGKDGSRSEKSIKVNVIANPPSSATVTAEGALLGTQEESGAVSTMTIPAGGAKGASVNFNARTKAEVKTETGIDYDALGVTFLGAQEISSSQALNTPVGLSSGGFGPMVQPQQAVVQYSILPDGDGDGIGELMVVNTASVAPNGDVISDPVPQIQLGAATAGTQTLRSLQTGTLHGPPGTFIEIEATGFNQFSAFGNVAIFKSLVDGPEIELPALVNSHFEDENPIPTIGAYIPVFPAGAATMTLKNVGAGISIAPITISIETSPALSKEPAAIIDESLAEAIRVFSNNPDLQATVNQLETVRSNFAALSNNPTAEEEKVLNDIAVFIANSNANDLLSQIESGGGSGLRAQACSAPGILVSGAMAGYGVIVSTLAGIVALTAVITGPLALLLLGLAALGGTAIGAGLSTLLIQIYQCFIPPPAIAPGTCLPPLTPLESVLPTPIPIPSPSPSPGGPDGIRAQQLAPANPITGMGSVVPPGGDSCGSAIGGDPGGTFGLRSLNLQSQSTGISSLLGDLAGRFIIKVFYGAGNVVPFTGVSDSSGYFYLPLIPEGQPFEAIAFDTLTKETRKFEGTGPEVGQSTYMFFDFLNEGESGAKILSYDTHTQGVYGDVDTYLFEGKAGDLINLGIFTEGGNLGNITIQLSDPNGRSLRSFLTSGGFYIDVASHNSVIELTSDGLYSFTIDGSKTSGNYTLGLAKIDPPTPIDFTAPVVGNITTLGDKQFYSFTGKAGDVMSVTLSAPVMNVTLTVAEPDLTHPFYQQQPIFFELFTLRNRNQHSSSFSKTLTKDGDYVLELFNDYPFDEQMQTYLGTYQVDISLTH
jgi:Bacterial Ig domain